MMNKENAKSERQEKEFDTLCGGIQPYPDLKEIKKQLRSGKLTKEQAMEMCRKYMEDLEYNGEWLTDCGGIRPIVIDPEKRDPLPSQSESEAFNGPCQTAL
jgi:hypothetical protein